MADGFQAHNPETKADQCLPKLWGRQRSFHISACQATRLVITLSHAGREEMPAKDTVAPHPKPQLCQAMLLLVKNTELNTFKLNIRKTVTHHTDLINSSKSTHIFLADTQSGLPKMIYLIFKISPQ